MSPGEPQVRASWLKYTVRSAKRYAAPHGQRVLDAIGPELRAQVREAGSLSFLPAERFIAVCNAVRDALQIEGARSFWQKSLRDCINEPLMRPLAHGGVFLFGRSPEGMYRRTPQAWSLVTRQAGQLSVEPGPEPNSVILHVRELPAVCRTNALLHMWEGGFVGQAQFVEFWARVETDDRMLGQGSADFLIRWKDARVGD